MASFGDQLTDTGEVKVDEGLSFGEQIDDSPSNIGTFMAGIGSGFFKIPEGAITKYEYVWVHVWVRAPN